MRSNFSIRDISLLSLCMLPYFYIFHLVIIFRCARIEHLNGLYDLVLVWNRQTNILHLTLLVWIDLHTMPLYIHAVSIRCLFLFKWLWALFFKSWSFHLQHILSRTWDNYCLIIDISRTQIHIYHVLIGIWRTYWLPLTLLLTLRKVLSVQLWFWAASL